MESIFLGVKDVCRNTSAKDRNILAVISLTEETGAFSSLWNSKSNHSDAPA